jgi:hypothetical protein
MIIYISILIATVEFAASIITIKIIEFKIVFVADTMLTTIPIMFDFLFGA